MDQQIFLHICWQVSCAQFPLRTTGIKRYAVIGRWVIRESPSRPLLDIWGVISRARDSGTHSEWSMWTFCHGNIVCQQSQWHLNSLSWNGSSYAGLTIGCRYRNKAWLIVFISSNNTAMGMMGIWTAGAVFHKYTILCSLAV